MDFATKAQNTEFRFTQAEQLLPVAESLFERMKQLTISPQDKVGFHKASMFLLGIALENAFKGVVASNGGIVVKNNKIKTQCSFPNCENHNLKDLARLVKLNLNVTETAFLERLSVYTIWAGKYGTPLSDKEFEKSKGLMIQHTRDFPLAKEIIHELKSRTEYDEQSGWPPLNDQSDKH